MRSRRVIIAILMFLALVLGVDHSVPSTGGIGQPAQAAESIGTSSEHSLPGNCAPCTASDMANTACVAPACTGVQAMAVSAVALVFANAAFAAFIEQRVSGSMTGPDLPPPKLNILA